MSASYGVVAMKQWSDEEIKKGDEALNRLNFCDIKRFIALTLWFLTEV
jgi:hypothetical protein